MRESRETSADPTNPVTFNLGKNLIYLHAAQHPAAAGMGKAMVAHAYGSPVFTGSCRVLNSPLNPDPCSRNHLVLLFRHVAWAWNTLPGLVPHCLQPSTPSHTFPFSRVIITCPTILEALCSKNSSYSQPPSAGGTAASCL